MLVIVNEGLWLPNFPEYLRCIAIIGNIIDR